MSASNWMLKAPETPSLSMSVNPIGPPASSKLPQVTLPNFFGGKPTVVQGGGIHRKPADEIDVDVVLDFEKQPVCDGEFIFIRRLEEQQKSKTMVTSNESPKAYTLDRLAELLKTATKNLPNKTHSGVLSMFSPLGAHISISPDAKRGPRGVASFRQQGRYENFKNYKDYMPPGVNQFPGMLVWLAFVLDETKGLDKTKGYMVPQVRVTHRWPAHSHLRLGVMLDYGTRAAFCSKGEICISFDMHQEFLSNPTMEDFISADEYKQYLSNVKKREAMLAS